MQDEFNAEGHWLSQIYCHNYSKRGHEHVRFQIMQTIEWLYDVEIAHNEIVECNPELLKVSKEQWETDPKYWLQKCTDPEDIAWI